MEIDNRNYYAAIIHGLSGSSPKSYWGYDVNLDESYRIREKMKEVASSNRNNATPATRAIYFVIHAYSHWWRVSEEIDHLDEIMREECFPAGMNFKRYLSAWLYSVGLHCLGMTTEDLEMVYQIFGVPLLPHPLLPAGRSIFELSLCGSSAQQESTELVAVQMPTEDEWHDLIESYLNSEEMAAQDEFSMVEIFQGALGIDPVHIRKPEQTRVSQILGGLGWIRVMKPRDKDHKVSAIKQFIYKYRRPGTVG